ncbi:MAG: MBOAT family protein [Bacteriovoracaceae bacterium]
MVFNSYLFIFLFLPSTWIIYFGLNRYRLTELSKAWLLIASLFYYSYWNIKYLPLILVSISVNFFLTEKLTQIENENKRKLLFYIGLLFNIGLLGYYKYTGFFLENLSLLTGSHIEFIKVALPVGISFYTLQQIAYLIDVYQGAITQGKRILEYALFVVFFPHLLAGPIVHFEEMLPQYQSLKNKVINKKNISLGIFIFTLGLFKKVMIADSLSVWVNDAYSDTSKLHLFYAWGTSLAYTLQLYFDFSGYSDMAIGIGRLFNFELPQNFNSPLKAANINDFWSRWHMTLTSFIRTYIFTPMVKILPKGFHFNMLAMVLAMTIAGIWHGPSWTYIVYGILHGLAIVVHYYWKKTKRKLPYFLGWLITFNFVNLSFIIFRSNTLNDAFNVMKGMLGLQNIRIPKTGINAIKNLHEHLGIQRGPYMTNDENLQLSLIIIGFFILLKLKNTRYWQENFKPSISLAILTGVMFVLCLFGLNRVSDFIYFNF